MLGRQLTGWISGGDSKMFTMSSMFLSFASTPLEAHLQIHPEPIQVEGEEHFEVEALLQHRSRGSSR